MGGGPGSFSAEVHYRWQTPQTAGDGAGDHPHKPAGVSERHNYREEAGGGDDVKEMEGRKRVLILVLARGLLCSDAGVYAMSMSWLHSKRRVIELAQTAIQSPNITHKHILLLLFP